MKLATLTVSLVIGMLGAIALLGTINAGDWKERQYSGAQYLSKQHGETEKTMRLAGRAAGEQQQEKNQAGKDRAYSMTPQAVKQN